MKKKKTIKKVKPAIKKTKKKVVSFVKKSNKKAEDVIGTLKNQWKKEQPHREKLRRAANTALENSIKIGGDVFETIKKDINEIKRKNKTKKSR